MSVQKTYTINSAKAISENLDGETIIINLENGSYYSLNPVGTLVWEAIAKSIPVDATEQSVADFLTFLQDEDLITEEDEAGEKVAPFSPAGKPSIEKYSDMQEMLLADPIHDVDTAGWPKLKGEV